MKYCLKWNNLSKKLDKADEISIIYQEDRGLVDFMRKYANKRIILRIDSYKFHSGEIAKLAAIRKQYPELEFTVAMDHQNLALALIFTQKEIPFYFLTPVQDWETFNWYAVDLKVSDIDISGPLGFELPKVKRFLEKNDLSTIIRATPNKVHAITQGCPPIKSFFIRPEDIDTYAEYIDVIEFEGVEHQDTFFNIYAKEKMFVGKLPQVIYNFPTPIDGVGIPSAFAEKRIRCGRECLSGGRCNRCAIIESLAEKAGYQIRKRVDENIKNLMQ